jgi:predicted Zn-dependent protease
VADVKVKPAETDLPRKPRWPVDRVPPGTDPLKLTHDQEVKLGQAVHEVILEHHHVLQPGDNPAFVNRLYALAAPFLDQRSRKDIEPKIYLLDSDDVVAFSHLGGYIYLSRYLQRWITSDVELMFLIAHEIAHLDQRDGLHQAAKAMAAKQPSPRGGEPGLVQRIYHQIAAGYAPDQDYAADQWAARQLLRMGKTRHEILLFLRRLEHFGVQEKANPTHPLKPLAALEAEVQDVEAHLQRHPPIPFRVNLLEKVIDAGPAAQ